MQERGKRRRNSPRCEASVVLIFAEPVAIFLTNKLNGLTNFLEMEHHCALDRIAIMLLKGGKDIVMLA